MPTTMDLRKIGSHIQPPRSAYKYASFACIASHHTLAVDPVQLQLQRKERDKHGVVQATPRVRSPARRRFPCRLSS